MMLNTMIGLKISTYLAFKITSDLREQQFFPLCHKHCSLKQRLKDKITSGGESYKLSKSKVTVQFLLVTPEMPSVEKMIITCQLRLTGHVIRLESSRLSKAVSYGELTKGSRKTGAS